MAPEHNEASKSQQQGPMIEIKAIKLITFCQPVHAYISGEVVARILTVQILIFPFKSFHQSMLCYVYLDFNDMISLVHNSGALYIVCRKCELTELVTRTF